MTREEWLKKYRAEFGSKYEALFVQHVLPLVVGLDYDALVAQFPFRDLDGRQRYCDFVIQEGDSIRIALEIDGYDKRGTGHGQTREDHADYHRREASLVALGFRVLRFANIDVRERPSRCADLITQTLKNERSRRLSTEESKALQRRIDEMQNALVGELRGRNKTGDKPPMPAQRSSSRNFGIASLVTLVVALVMAVVWRGGSVSAGEAMASKPETTCNLVDSIDEGIATCEQEDGSVVRVFATPGMREGTFSCCPGATPIARSTPVAGATIAMAGESGRGAQPARAKPLPGSSCEAAFNWDSAREHIGETHAIAGQLVTVTESPPNTRGDPTWIEVGAPFPNSKRLSLVVWGNRRSSFPTARLQGLIGTRVCVVGEIQDYKGVARIELRTPDQLRVLR